MRTSTITLLLAVLSTSALAQPGTLDATFGTGGVVLTQVSAIGEQARAVAIQDDGKIVVAGYTQTGNFDIVVLRYLTNGDLDTTFATGGIATLAFGTAADMVNDMQIQADGKIVIVGQIQFVTAGDRSIALARYNTDGSLDNTFSGDGMVTFDLPTPCVGDEYGLDLIIRPDGRMVVTGWCATNTSDRFITLGVTPFGVLDVAGFNQPYGLMLRDLNWDGANDQGLASILRADGTLVQAGKIHFGADYDFVITGLEADGTQDLSAFAPPNGHNPIEMGSSTDAATSIVELPSGRLVLLGSTSTDWALAGFTSTGMLDMTFGTNGKTFPVVGTFNNVIGKAILHPWDKILAVGASADSSGGAQLTLLRFLNDGSLDPTFDGDGIVRMFILGNQAYGTCAALQADGKIVAAGSGISGGDPGILVARFENDFPTGVAVNGAGHAFDLVTWPNPADDQLRLNISSNGPGRVDILDATGRVVRSMHVTNANGLLIPVTDLQPGSYLLRFDAGDIARTAAFIIAR